jgi:hypothetical protein
MTKHILFEINEICPYLIDNFEDAGFMPNFKKYRSYFNRYKTLADAQPPALEPWIQWYSVHTGLPYSEHGVFRLTEGSTAGHPDIWTILKSRGFKVMNFSSMNTAALLDKDDFFFPDPWNNQKANPESLQSVASFVASQVRDYTLPNQKINYISFAQGLLGHGLSLSTIMNAIKQLSQENFSDKDYKYKRIFVLDGILIDMFLHYHAKYQPNFATFFSNSVAHIQHAYWRYFEPEKFDMKIDKPILKDAIKNAYINIDYRFGQLMRYALANNIQVSVASALSQRPYVKEEAMGGRHYYRPRNIHDLLEKLNIVPLACEPVMTHQYILCFRDLQAKQNAQTILNHGKLIDNNEEAPLFTIQDANNGISLIFDCKPRTPVSNTAKARLHNSEYAFDDLFYMIDEIKSGGHDPIGLFWQQADDNKGKDFSDEIYVHKLLDKLLMPFDKKEGMVYKKTA